MYDYVGTVYLLDELKYSQSKFAVMSLLRFPCSLISAFIIAHTQPKKLLRLMLIVLFIKLLLQIFIVNVVFYFYYDGIVFDVLLFFTLGLVNILQIMGIVTFVAYGNII